MSIFVYKLIHVVGFLMVFAALGGLLLHALNGGTRESNRGRALVGATHGLGLVLVLVSGFGLLAKLGVGFPPWVWGKVVVWLVAGAFLVLIRRLPRHAAALWVALLVLGAVAAWLAFFKPGGVA